MPRPKKSPARAMPSPNTAQPRVFDPARIIDDLQAGIRGVRLSNLPDVVEALERGAAPRGGAPGDADVVDGIARRVAELEIGGSKLDAIQRAVVMQALAECDGNLSAAARLLGMERKALERRVARYRDEA